MENKKYPWKISSTGEGVGVALLIFILVCLFASWLGEKMFSYNEYYGGNGSYLQEACPDCDQP